MNMNPVQYFGHNRYLTSRIGDFMNFLREATDKGANDFLFVDPYSIGDVVHSLGFLPAFRRIYCEPSQRIIFLCQKRATKLAEVMPYADKVVGMDLSQHELALEYVASLSNTLSPEIPIICANDMYAMGRLVRLGAHPLAIKRGIQFLNQSEPFTPPMVSDALRRTTASKMAESGVVPGRSLLVVPNSMSFASFSLAFWSKLVDQLKLRRPDLALFTDTTMGNELIPGTRPVHILLDELIPAVEHAGHGLFLRSGLVDLCAWADAEIHSIVPPKALWKHIPTAAPFEGIYLSVWFANTRVADHHAVEESSAEAARLGAALFQH